MSKLKLGILGSGRLGGMIAEAWQNGYLEDYELVGVTGRNGQKTEALAAKTGVKACSTVEELLALSPDYIAEAASVAAVRENAEKILSAGCSFVVLSIGAFADADFYQKTAETAREHCARVHIASGAVGGFDVLRTVSLMSDAMDARFETHKGPASLRNTPLFEEHLMTDSGETKVFSGTAKEAIALLPTKVNVAVASSLAMNGPEHTKVNIFSVPDFIGDDHKITAEIDGVKAVVDIYSAKSDIAAWSVVAALRNITAPIVF